MTRHLRFAIGALCAASVLASSSAWAVVSVGPGGSGVTVGNSSLIQARDLSDGFTGTLDGSSNPSRPYAAALQPAPAYVLEYTDGHASRSWTSSFSFARDPVNPPDGFVNGVLSYPGGSGAGSATGFTQTGGGVDYGVSYGLRNNFVAQFDTTQTSDRVDITTSSVQGGLASATGLSVFIRTTGHGLGEIGLYRPGPNETVTSLTSGIATAGGWHNYAVNFDRANNSIEVFVDEVSRGTVNLNTFAGGAYANFATNAVNFGSSGNSVTWTDNAQIGVRNVIGPASLVAYLPFDEASGTAYDRAFAHNGTLGAGATRVPGAVGNGVSFNNTVAASVGIGNGTLGIDNKMAFSTGIAVEALIRPSWSGASFDYDEIYRKEDGGNRILLSFQNDPNNGGANPPVAAGPVLSFGLNVGGVYRELDMPLDGVAGRPTLAQLNDGSFHHVVATYDSATGLKAIYIDGILRHSVIEAGLITSGGGATGTIGNISPGGGEAFTGIIDEFALYSASLSGAAVAQHYRNVQLGQNYFAVIVPEPATMSLLALAAAGLLRRRRAA